MPFLCAVFGYTYKSTDKRLSIYRFPKSKKNAASDINTLLPQQRESWFNMIHRSAIVDSQSDSIRISS